MVAKGSAKRGDCTPAKEGKNPNTPPKWS